jgi:RHS repeat-associated protein
VRPGAAVSFTVYEPPGENCAAQVTITSSETSLATIDGPPVVMTMWQPYTIHITGSATSGTVLINAHYIGQDRLNNTQGPCQGEGDLPLILTIKEPTGESAANAPFSGWASDPVNTLTGELSFHEPPDLNLGGPMPLFFQRYYGSNLASSTMSSNLGNNWRHNFDWTLNRAGASCLVVSPEGRVVSFNREGSSWVQQDGRDVAYQLIENATDGSYTLHSPAAGRFYAFDANGILRQIQDGRGNTHYLSYGETEWSNPGRLTEVWDTQDGSGRNLRCFYNSTATASRITQVKEYHGTPDYPYAVSGRSVLFTYTGDDQTGYDLTVARDPSSNNTTYAYDAAGVRPGLLTGRTRPVGNTPYSQTYDSQGRVATQTDSQGHVSSFVYDPVSGVTTVTDPLNRTLNHTHANRALTAWVDRLGHPVSMTYDSQGRRTSITDRLGAVTARTFHPGTGKIASTTDAENHRTDVTYTARTWNGFTLYDVTGTSFPDGSSASFTPDGTGNLLAYTDRAGKVWGYTYNGKGQILTATNPAGGVTTATYRADGTLETLKDALNQTTTFTYDSKRRLTRITHPDATYREYSYDNNNRLKTVRDERANTIYYTYDGNGRLTQVIDRAGYYVVKNIAYDGNDRPLSWTDAYNKVTTFTYDELGRMATAQNRIGDTVQFGYDNAGRLTTITDPAGNVLTTTYDAEGAPLTMTGPGSQAWSFVTDRLGRTTQASSPLANRTQYAYDALGRLSAWSSAVSRMDLAYDTQGLSGVTLPGGIAPTYGRNDLGQITRVTDAAGNALTRTIDAAGRLASKTDRLGTATAFGYDSRNRVSTVTLPQGVGTLQLTYDGTGNVTRRLYSDGTDLNFTYDNNGRILTANGLALEYDSNGKMKKSNGLVITRDNAGRVAAVRMVPTNAMTTVTYTYNSRGLVSQVSDWRGGATTLDYDAVGRLILLSRPNGTSTQYVYDADGKLTGINEKKGATVLATIGLTRGAGGVVTAARRDVPLHADPTGSRSFAYNADDQVTGYTYDAMGRLTADADRTYTWDLASRLASYTQGGSAVSFTYDGLGMRTSRTAGGATRNYVLNYALGLPSLSVVRNGSNADLFYYVHLPNGQILHQIDVATGTRKFFHFDETGTTLFLTDETGEITDRYGVQPYGLTVSQGATENPFVYQGAWGVMAEGGGLHYLRARYYDALSARFLSRDPVESIHPLKINPYQYALENPMGYGDPRGLDACAVAESCFSPMQGESCASAIPDESFTPMAGFGWPGSFAGYAYDRQGPGDVVLAKDVYAGGSFAVDIRNEQCGSAADDAPVVCTSGMAFRSSGRSIALYYDRLDDILNVPLSRREAPTKFIGSDPRSAPLEDSSGAFTRSWAVHGGESLFAAPRHGGGGGDPFVAHPPFLPQSWQPWEFDPEAMAACETSCMTPGSQAGRCTLK